jgi:polar amino acid transport system substrate-binding protein
MATRPARLSLLTLLPLLAASALGAGGCAAQDMVFIAPTNHVMPLVGLQQGQLVAGILKDIGDTLAARLGRRATYLVLPSKRVPLALQEGKADALCYVMPSWVEGDFAWTQPFIPDDGVVIAVPGAPVLGSLHDLADTPVGTVAGYIYPRVAATLGAHFHRNDAPAMQNNYDKLLAGRTQYAITEQISYLYYQRHHPESRLRRDVLYESFTAPCALSRHSNFKLADVDKAISAMIADGTVAAIMARYR